MTLTLVQTTKSYDYHNTAVSQRSLWYNWQGSSKSFKTFVLTLYIYSVLQAVDILFDTKHSVSCCTSCKLASFSLQELSSVHTLVHTAPAYIHQHHFACCCSLQSKYHKQGSQIHLTKDVLLKPFKAFIGHLRHQWVASAQIRKTIWLDLMGLGSGKVMCHKGGSAGEPIFSQTAKS